MGVYRDVFDMAAKAGSLEGFVYQRPEAATHDFANWLDNIQRMYAALPSEARADLREQYREVLGKVAGHMEKVLRPTDRHLLRLKTMLAEAAA